jgi:proline iminopeptidase
VHSGGPGRARRTSPGVPRLTRWRQPRLTDWFPTVDITIDPQRQPSPWDVRDRLGELAVLADAGHFGHLEEPKQFFGSVLRFAAAH